MRKKQQLAMSARPMIAAASAAVALLAQPETLRAAEPVLITLQPAPAAARFTATGMLTITTDISASDQLPDGAVVSYSARASLFDSSYTNSRSFSGSARVVARKVTLSLRLPYIWLMATATGQMNVSLFLSSSASNIGGPRYSFSTNLTSTLAVPPNGTVTPIAFSGSL